MSILRWSQAIRFAHKVWREPKGHAQEMVVLHREFQRRLELIRERSKLAALKAMKQAIDNASEKAINGNP